MPNTPHLTGPGHYREAERLYAVALNHAAAIGERGAEARRDAGDALAEAQYHMLAASTAATADLLVLLVAPESEDGARLARAIVRPWSVAVGGKTP
jgi:hypothetical protein